MGNRSWERIGWGVAGLVTLGALVLGFLVLAPGQQDGRRLGPWEAIRLCFGIPSDRGAPKEPQPPLRTPSRVAWTPTTLARVAAGDPERGEFIAFACVACHGPEGVSASSLYPSLAGMEAAVIFKQLDDFRAFKRPNGVMNAIARALTDEAAADVAAYFASRPGGLRGGGSAHRPADAALIRLAELGDPSRGIAPCAACHGPAARKLGAPALGGQQGAYLERQLLAFAQRGRENDLNEQMRAVAAQLTQDEIHGLAQLYGVVAELALAGR